jgi:hypothetical protein
VSAWAKKDPTGQYRYLLGREWEPSKGRVVFVMLNPSIADEEQDDPTLRKCVEFAKAWGFGSLEVVNLFAYRATKPEELYDVKDPVGPENDRYVLQAINRASKIIVAWGKDGSLRNRDQKVLWLIPDDISLYCLGQTKDRDPRHPGRVKNNTEPVVFVKPEPSLQGELDLRI